LNIPLFNNFQSKIVILVSLTSAPGALVNITHK